METRLFLVAVGIAFSLAGCGSRTSSSPEASSVGAMASDAPTEADALAFVQTLRAAHARATAVNKLDGLRREQNGVEQYDMQVRVTYSCEAWPRYEEYFTPMTFSLPELNCLRATEGEERHAEGWVRFERRESGWAGLAY